MKKPWLKFRGVACVGVFFGIYGLFIGIFLEKKCNFATLTIESTYL